MSRYICKPELVHTTPPYTCARSKTPIRWDVEMICRRGWASRPGTENGWEIKEMARSGYCAGVGTYQSSNSFIRRTKQWVVGGSNGSMRAIGHQMWWLGMSTDAWNVTFYRVGVLEDCARARGQLEDPKSWPWPLTVLALALALASMHWPPVTSL